MLSFLPFLNLDVLLKLAANISDLLIGITLYKIIKEKLNKRIASIAAALYIFNPAIIFNSAIWGQYDSFAILFLVLCIYFLINKNSPVISSIFFSIAWSIKPQTIQLAPFMFLFFLRNFKFVQWSYSLMAFLITTIIIFLPFFPNNPIYGIYYVNTGSINLFNCTTCNALNFWGIFGNWQNDMNLFLGIPMLNWGLILLLISLLIIFIKQSKGNMLYLTLSLSMLAFFMFLTRMHERYISYFLPLLLISVVLLKSKILAGFYLFFSLIFLLNLYIPYAYYNNSQRITNLPYGDLIYNHAVLLLLSLSSFLGFILLFIYYLNYGKNNSTS